MDYIEISLFCFRGTFFDRTLGNLTKSGASGHTGWTRGRREDKLDSLFEFGLAVTRLASCIQHKGSAPDVETFYFYLTQGLGMLDFIDPREDS